MRRRRSAGVAIVACVALPLTGCGLADNGYDVAGLSTSDVRRYLPAATLQAAAGNMSTATLTFEVDASLITGDGEYRSHTEGGIDPASGAHTWTTQEYWAASTEPLRTAQQTVVGDRLYLRRPVWKGWVRFTAAEARDAGWDMTDPDPFQTRELLEYVKDEAQRIGRGTVNNVETTKYHGVLEVNGDVMLFGATLESMTVTVYLDENARPAHVVVNASGNINHDEPASLSITADYTGWGDPLTIRAPKSSVPAAKAGMVDRVTPPEDAPPTM